MRSLTHIHTCAYAFVCTQIYVPKFCRGCKCKRLRSAISKESHNLLFSFRYKSQDETIFCEEDFGNTMGLGTGSSLLKRVITIHMGNHKIETRNAQIF